MKTIITSSGSNVSSAFDKRFGRAQNFCLYDDSNNEVKFLANEFANASNGAGAKVAEKMVELGVEKIISGDFGPKAKDLLDKFGIQLVIMAEDDLKVEDIIKKLNN